MSKQAATEGSVAINLKRPTKDGGVELPVLTMRPPTVGDHLLVARFAGKNQEYELNLFANLCGVTLDAMKGILMSDWRKLQKAYGDFLEMEDEE